MILLNRILTAVLLALPINALGGQVAILAADFSRQGDAAWNVSVTLEHADSGWDHYADAWRVVDAKGADLGTRTLYHPHVDEQPFTRSLGGVKIPARVTTVYIEAHDKVHGWSDQRLQIDLGQARNGRLRVQR